MRGRRLMFVALGSALAGSITFAQPGRGGSQWLTALADAQRTSWVRADDKISVAALSKPGFEQQWKVKLDNQPRGVHGLAQGVTASGVTLFVPMSVVAGSSNNVYGIDNDIGYVVWRRHFDAALPAATAACAGGITSAATRIVRLDSPTTAAAAGFGGGRARGAGYRSLLGEPGEGVPAEGRAAGPGRAGDPSGAAAPGGRGAPPGVEQGAARGAAPPPPAVAANQAVERIPGAPRPEESGSPFGFLFRPSGVSYVVSSDGMLHVIGLSSGKDIQRPAPFLPANSKWSAPVGVGTTLYAATSGKCGGAPDGVWAIDLDSDAKPVVSWKTNGGGVVGAVAFTSDGTLIAAIGPGQTTGERQGERDRRPRPQDAAVEGMVLSADGGIRHWPDDPPAQQQEHCRRGDEGRTRPAAGRGVTRGIGSRDAARGVEGVARRGSLGEWRGPGGMAAVWRRHVMDSGPGQGAPVRGK